MRVVRESVQEDSSTAFNRCDDFFARKHSAEWRVSTRDTFANENHIGLHTPMFNGEAFSRAAHPAS